MVRAWRAEAKAPPPGSPEAPSTVRGAGASSLEPTGDSPRPTTAARCRAPDRGGPTTGAVPRTATSVSPTPSRRGRPPVLALTATATESAARDVGELLRLPAPLVARVVARTSCERPNLTLSVVRAPSPERKREAPDAILARERGAGIVSTTTVKRADELWGSLCERFGEGIGNLDERPDPGVATRSRTRGGRTRGTAVAIPLER